MNDLLFIVILCLTVYSLVKLLISPNLILEFPYFMSAAFIAFILPQASNLYYSDNLIPPDWLEAVLLMIVLCWLCCYWGYSGSIKKMGPLKMGFAQLDEKRLREAAVVMIIVGTFFSIKVYRMAPEAGTLWTGIITIYLFFSTVIYLGFALMLYDFIRSRKFVSFFWMVVAGYYPIMSILNGRREPTAFFVFIILLAVFFNYRSFTIPRWAVAGFILVALIGVPATTYYRKNISLGLNPYEAVASIDFKKVAEQDVNEGKELLFGSMQIAHTRELGSYQWGAGYWDEVVWRFVPAQIVGKDVKGGMMVFKTDQSYGLGDKTRWLQEVGIGNTTGFTITGMADSFKQLWFFGCVFFLLCGMFYARIWTTSLETNNVLIQVFYISSITPGIRAITHQTSDFLPGVLANALFLYLAFLYARKK